MKLKSLLLIAAVAPLLIGAGTGSTSTRSPAKEEQYYNRGVKAQQRGAYEEAVKWYRRALDERSDYPDALNNLGFSLRSIAKRYLDEANQAYNRALDIDRGHEEALEYQGELFIWQGKLKAAARNYERLKDMGSPQAGTLKRELDAVLDEARAVL